MPDERLEIQKRYTLNWLIQGASEHAGMTLHHLVRDELNAFDSRLLRSYDQIALLGLLQYWRGVVRSDSRLAAPILEPGCLRTDSSFFRPPAPFQIHQQTLQ